MSAFFGLELNEGQAEYFRASAFTPLVLLQRATIVFTSAKTLPLGCVVRLKSRIKHGPSQVLASFIIGKVESVSLNCEFSDDVRLSISREEEGDTEEGFDFSVHVTGLVVFNTDTGGAVDLEENEDEDMSSDDSEEEEEDSDSLSWSSDTTTDEDLGREKEEPEEDRAIRCLTKAPAHVHVSTKEWKYEQEERLRIQREAIEKPIEEEVQWREFDRKTMEWWRNDRDEVEGFEIQGETKKSKELPTFSYTGRLRPSRVTATTAIPVGLQPPDYAQTSWPEEEQSSRLQTTVEVKTAEQIKKMKRACSLARFVLDTVASHLRVGVETDELDRICHTVCLQNGAYPSPLNYMGFPKSICTSVNEVVCHGIPDRRKLEPGDIINLDVTVCLNRYHGDLSETFIVGCAKTKDKVKLEENKRLLSATLSALEKAIHSCRPGKRFRTIGELIQNEAVASEKWTSVKHYCGHGIGKLFHCAPTIPHYAPNKAVGFMKRGQTFTIEPMFCAGTRAAKHWKDGWTAVTSDGKNSAQYEHTILILDDGPEVLTKRTSKSVNFFIDD